jgi:hypothetical protein
MNQNNSPHEIEVTVPIDEDDFDEYPDLGPDWLDCPILPPDEMFAVIGRCGELDRRSVNLFAALERRPRSGLAELFLWRNLYQPNSHYIYVTPDPVRYGYTYWRPIATKVAIQANMVAPCALFSNTLSWGDAPPSKRAYNAGFTVYTFEFDHTPLDDQLRVIWSGKLKGIEAELCRFRDYGGMRRSTRVGKASTSTSFSTSGTSNATSSWPVTPLIKTTGHATCLIPCCGPHTRFVGLG